MLVSVGVAVGLSGRAGRLGALVPCDDVVMMGGGMEAAGGGASALPVVGIGQLILTLPRRMALATEVVDVSRARWIR